MPAQVASPKAVDEVRLPCLNSNISIENDPEHPSKLVKLSTSQRKTSFILKASVESLCARFGIQNVGFLTLTFADNVQTHSEASKRLNSLITNVIKPRYQAYVGVAERQKSGRIHFHLVVALDVDIRTGFNFEEIENQNYSSANPCLRKEWSFWRINAPKFRFGRTELLPIKSSAEAVSRYVGKYIAKHVEHRDPRDKGARLVRYSKNARIGTTRFMFNSEGSREWRRKVQLFVEILNNKYEIAGVDEKITCLADLSRVLGPKWAFENREYILNLP